MRLLRDGFEVCSLAASPRSRSEDRSGCWFFPWGVALAVADGAGGMTGGAEAAERAVRSLGERLARADVAPTAEAWRGLLAELDAELERDPRSGESTLAALSLGRAGVAGAAAGDSVALRFAAGRWEALTEEAHRKRRLGSGRALPVGFARGDEGALLLLASDGLAGPLRAGLGAPEGELEAWGTRLIDAARGPSGALGDDVALVLARRAP